MLRESGLLPDHPSSPTSSPLRSLHPPLHHSPRRQRGREKYQQGAGAPSAVRRKRRQAAGNEICLCKLPRDEKSPKKVRCLMELH